jgi:hypothetical protein
MALSDDIKRSTLKKIVLVLNSLKLNYLNLDKITKVLWYNLSLLCTIMEFKNNLKLFLRMNFIL